MKLFRFVLFCALFIFIFAFFNSDWYGVRALEAKHKTVGKVKCKEQVDEALRQYWDKDAPKGDKNDDGDNDGDDDDDDDDSKELNPTPSNEDDDDDDDDDSNDDDSSENSNDNVKQSKEEADDDNSDEDGDSKNADDDDDDDNDDDDDEDDDDSKESASTKEKNTKSAEDDDDDDDDDDSKEAAKVRSKKNAPVKDDDDDDDDDDDNDDDDDSKEDKGKKINTPAKTTSTATVPKKDTKKEAEKPAKSSKVTSSSGKIVKNEKKNAAPKKKDDDSDEDDEEEEERLKKEHQQKRSRIHIDDILRVYEIGSQDDNLELNLIQSIFRDLKKIYESTVKPLETIYKYRQITTRLITDAEIFSKPMILFLGGKSTGKSSLVNYLLGIDDTPWAIKTGAAAQTKFTILSYGENYTHLSPTELSADYTFSSLQRFGEHFLTQYIDAHRLPINILQKMTIVDSPGLIDLLPSKTAQQTIDNDVYQWFIDRSDVIYIVIDVSQLHLSSSLRVLLDQLKGREVRFIISKGDIASHSQIISMFGQLLWVLSPIMSAERPPLVYALTTLPQDDDEFLDAQESSWLKDLSAQLSGISRIESHIAEVRRHAVRVRNHAKLVDCYLSTYYRNKGLFTFGASSRQLAADISENPHQYRIYSGAFIGQLQNVSRYDLPDPGVYREFFRSNPLIDFKPLTSTCSYFRGCPIDKLDVAIAYDLPELVSKYKKLTKAKFDQN